MKCKPSNTNREYDKKVHCFQWTATSFHEMIRCRDITFKNSELNYPAVEKEPTTIVEVSVI